MTKAELITRINEIEWEDFEVKAATSEIPKSSWETVSAFANTNGGWLIFGISQIGNTFEITGVKNAEKLEQDFLNTLRGEKFNARVFTRQSLLKLNNKKVLCFYVEPSADKPIYFNNPANTFIRRGSTDQRASKEEIDSMFRDQAFGTKTSQVVPGSLSSSRRFWARAISGLGSYT
jgi:ATP-dependent DNA helicase RecG